VNKAGVRGCPVCDADWDGGSILEEFKKQRDEGSTAWAGMSDAELEVEVKKCYGPPYRWGREIGIEIQGGYDGISYYQCPDCSALFDRFTGKHINPRPKNGALSTYHHAATRNPDVHAYLKITEPNIAKLWLISDTDSDKNQAYEGVFEREANHWFVHVTAGTIYKFPIKGITTVSELDFTAMMGGL